MFEETKLLWDPSFDTWRSLGVQANSQFMLLTPDLQEASTLLYGFDEDIQSQIVEALSAP